MTRDPLPQPITLDGVQLAVRNVETVRAVLGLLSKVETIALLAQSLSIGTVESGPTAAVSLSGSPPNQRINFVLPQGPAGASPSAGFVRNVDTNLLHQVQFILGPDGDPDFALSPPVNPSGLSLLQADGVKYWDQISGSFYSIKVRDNPDGDPGPYVSPAAPCPDLFLLLVHETSGKQYKLQARNDADGDPEPFLVSLV